MYPTPDLDPTESRLIREPDFWILCLVPTNANYKIIENRHALVPSQPIQNCFRKALVFLNWTTTGGASTPTLARGVPTVDTPTASSAVMTSPRPSASDTLALGRFELLVNRNVERATAFFQACVEINRWHASGKVKSPSCAALTFTREKSNSPSVHVKMTMLCFLAFISRQTPRTWSVAMVLALLQFFLAVHIYRLKQCSFPHRMFAVCTNQGIAFKADRVVVDVLERDKESLRSSKGSRRIVVHCPSAVSSMVCGRHRHRTLCCQQ